MNKFFNAKTFGCLMGGFFIFGVLYNKSIPMLDKVWWGIFTAIGIRILMTDFAQGMFKKMYYNIEQKREEQIQINRMVRQIQDEKLIKEAQREAYLQQLAEEEYAKELGRRGII